MPNSLFRKNRNRFFSLFHKKNVTKQGDFALLRGASEVPLYNSDVSYPEYQEAFFYYLFGAVEMDCYGLLDLHNDHAILFVPRLDNLYKIWMTVMTKEESAVHYELEVRYIDEMEATLEQFKGSMYLNDGVNSDSGLKTILPDEKYLKSTTIDRETLYEILVESRVIKNDEEILALRWAS